MIYAKRLPGIYELKRLSRSVGDYPVSRDELLAAALKGNFSAEVIDIVSQFADDLLFKTPTDFIAQAEGLAMLLQEEREMPPEILHSPQD